MTLQDWLIKRARKFWDNGNNIPNDLLMEMVKEDMNVEELERQYFTNNEALTA